MVQRLADPLWLDVRTRHFVVTACVFSAAWDWPGAEIRAESAPDPWLVPDFSHPSQPENSLSRPATARRVRPICSQAGTDESIPDDRLRISYWGRSCGPRALIWLLAFRLARRATSCQLRLPASSCQLLASSFQLPAASYRLPASQLPAANCQLPATSYQLPATSYQLPASAASGELRALRSLP